MNKNNDITTYFLDLDGTLIDKRNKQLISYKNIEAIRLLKEYANVVISTGRNFSDPKVQELMLLLNVKDVISSSGSEIYIDGKLVKSYSIDNNIVNEIIKYAITSKTSFVTFHENGDSFYGSNNFYRLLGRTFAWKKFYEIENYKNYISKKRVLKIALIVSKLFSAKTILKKINLYFGNELKVNLASNNFILELTNIKADKGLAVVAYCKLKNLSLKNTIHIGDSMSDLSTKGYVGKLIAMNNSSKELKIYADYIGPKFSKAGIAQIIHSSLNIPYKEECKYNKKINKHIFNELKNKTLD
ncbi:HAD hydrolase family protein [Mycoplasmopsis lipophila]|uniref:HAD hydrolase family protein n=1 Tax=Mycoplasmopsis lipophila TaxID=2117 RepID=UPI00387383D6